MIDIPTTKTPRGFDSEVDEAVKAVLADLARTNGRAGALSVNHGCSHLHVMTDVAEKVAELFKAKGYHAHWCYSVKGVAYALEITTYPTEHDI